MNYTWANPDHIGIITVTDGIVLYLDSGPEYEAAVADGPAEYAGPIDVSPPIPAPTADEIRAQRNALLAASDWTQVADAPVDQTAWAAYRQALRDIPDQAGFPASVEWPVAPS
jgi:hypothetical protein